MKQERLNLYLIDMKYIRDLHNVDDRVSSVSPQIGKQHRIYVGVVILCNGRKYLIPLSHPVEKHKRMKPRADFDKIVDKLIWLVIGGLVAGVLYSVLPNIPW